MIHCVACSCRVSIIYQYCVVKIHLWGKCRVSLSKKGPKSASQRLSMLRSSTLGQMKALLLVIQKTPGNKTEIELAQSYALYSAWNRHTLVRFRSFFLVFKLVTNWIIIVCSANWANCAVPMLYELHTNMHLNPL